MYSFSTRNGMVVKMDPFWDRYRRNSKNWRIDPIAKVHPKIYLGSALNVDILTFHQRNVSHVVNCAQDYACPKWFKCEFPERYACIDAVDALDVDITTWYPLFEETMNKFLAKSLCTGIYVHCQAGMNRSAFLLLIYLCLKFKFKLDDAFKLIAYQRPCTFENKMFQKQVIEYIKKHE